MKFAKYLQSTEISEWRKAYIDYRGLKRLIKAVGFSRLSHDVHPSDMKASYQLPYSSVAHPWPSEADPHADERSLEDPGTLCYLPPFNFSVMDLSIEPPSDLDTEDSSSASILSVDSASVYSTQTFSFDTSSSSGLCRGLNLSEQRNDTRRFMDPSAELPLHEILTQLTPKELTFFSMLDAQLAKVESFYVAREQEMMARSLVLLNQLKELKDHREVFLETNTKKSWAANISSKLSFRNRPRRKPHTEEGQVFKLVLSPTASTNSRDKKMLFTSALPARTSGCGSPHPSEKKHGEEDAWSRLAERPHPGLSMSPNDPSSYIHAKRKLKKAVLEHYHGLETLQNYRVLNLAGFRKAVKKFEKITRIPVKKQYMAERVANCTFASDDGITSNMKREMERIYAAAFACGDKKKARKQLRASTSSKSYYCSIFRSGLLIGFAIYALIDGLLKACQPETQKAIPRWDILLFLYGLIFVPVLYSVLLGINLVVWVTSRINYIFIFDLDVSSRLDYRQYFEIPSLLLAALCFAFWASFSRLGDPILHYTTWPLLWLTFAILITVHPIPVMAKSSRYWFIKTMLKLFLSGMRPVEFVDFWIGDQLCSFIFTISNIPLFVCVYLDKFSDDWQKCKNSSRTWPIAFGLAIIPFIIRLVQCIKRYVDSKLVTHLINAGKYGTGILSYLFYFMWSYREKSRGAVFVLWCVINTCYSIYACSWDFLVDYSVLQLQSKHLFLRTELMYSNHQWAYYVAMLFNLLVRFMWIIYIPKAGPPAMARLFITGMFEMFRRLQWNIYRLENEHIGNMDQYRVSRQLPLPYAFDFKIRQEDRDGDVTLSGKR